ncbi:MAG: hydroxyproline-2-epimerase [Acidobacteria bacterium]|nr:hydroxyproline-2-epimerase [Acidobacteriota bacterium]
MKRVRVIDSHTGGEPTRVVIEGGPDLGQGSIAERLEIFRTSHDGFRSAVVKEPRGSDVMVGALLVPPCDSTSTAAVIFFNNVGYLGMCGHGAIGVVATLDYLNLIKPGPQRIETPVGVITATLAESGEVTIHNVPSYRYKAKVPIEVEGLGLIQGDIAWGGNWFFLVDGLTTQLDVKQASHWTQVATRIKQALLDNNITGENNAEIDHIEIFAPSPTANSRSFVLCPGNAYDRSPCGTGTSAKLACLAADGKLKEGDLWRQESIVGSHFDASYKQQGNQIVPAISGRAWVNSEAFLVLDPRDPFCWGIRG